MTKNNRKKAVAQAISTAITLGWVIMQVESAQAANLVVNNLNDSGVGSLRDTINIASNNDVLEFLLGSNPSTITLTSGVLAIAKNLTINGPGANLLTISSNNHLPVLDINAANVTFSGLAIAGNINAYNSSNLTFTNSTISGDNVNSAGNITINSGTLILNPGAIISKPVPEPSAIAAGSNHSGAAGILTITTNSLTVRPGALISKPVPEPSAIASGSNHSGAGGNITLTIRDLLILKPVRKPSAIADDSNNSGLGGNITISAPNGFIISKPVPEPSAIAGTILAGSLAWLVKRKQVVFRKAKV
ncbi:MAG: PEP-CTERM sorting domain-containing protein [Nostoc sp.]